ncbi:MAG: ABC transporter permease subunit [Phycisphaerae bacterium]|nr:ABC transporter permease subunit [Phycisphaerae bacterium]
MPERLMTHGLLVTGSALFAFPFVWMLLTSVKVDRETTADNLRFLPTTPRPQAITPYINSDEFDAPARPDDVPEAVWQATQPLLLEQLGAAVDAWTPSTAGPADNPPPATVDPDAYRTEMVEGLANALNKRLSDEVRQCAIESEKAARLAAGTEPPPNSVLARELSQPAIDAGVAAILADAQRIVDQQSLANTFDACYRRFCVEDVRVRAPNFRMFSLFTGDEWRIEDGDAEVVARDDGNIAAQEVRVRYSDARPSVTLEFESKTLPLSRDEIDRIYIRYRGDSTWAAVRFEIVCGGRRYRTTREIHLFERDWIEQELRWPEGAGDPLDRRAYHVLEDVGATPPGSPAFLARMIVERNSAGGAWLAKLTHNYRMAFREVPYARYISTSFAIVILNIVLAVFSCTLVAYAFARLQWPGRDLCFGVLLATMMIPPQVTMIPSFLVMKYLGWFNTLLPMWVPAIFGTPFFIFLLRQFFRGIPNDLEDAARIDGCGFLRIYWHVMLPLVKPTIATIAIFTFMWSWNNFMGPLIYVNDERLFPLALGLFKLNLRSSGNLGLMMAASFVMTLPVIILFFFAQRYFIQGITLTGTKG